MTGNIEAARKLLQTKTELRKAELDAADRHFERLREGRPESLETTFIASRYPERPQAHSFSHLLCRLSCARSRWRTQS